MEKPPSNLADYEIQKELVSEDVGYSNVVGQDSVSRFESKFKKKKTKKKYKGKKTKQEQLDAQKKTKYFFYLFIGYPFRFAILYG